MRYSYFKELSIGSHFLFNGNECIKQSTRTALFINENKWFYFGQNDLCTVLHSNTYKRGVRL